MKEEPTKSGFYIYNKTSGFYCSISDAERPGQAAGYLHEKWCAIDSTRFADAERAEAALKKGYPLVWEQYKNKDDNFEIHEITHHTRIARRNITEASFQAEGQISLREVGK